MNSIKMAPRRTGNATATFKKNKMWLTGGLLPEKKKNKKKKIKKRKEGKKSRLSKIAPDVLGMRRQPARIAVDRGPVARVTIWCESTNC
jgi:hypothetical protein